MVIFRYARLHVESNRRNMRLWILFLNYYQLRFSPAVATVVKGKKHNPKRMQRTVRKQLDNVWNRYKVTTGSKIAARVDENGA